MSYSITEAPNISSSLLQRRIEEITAGLQKAFCDKLLSISEFNAATIVEYIFAMKSEVKLSDNYRRDQIEVLTRFSKYNNNKPFKDLTRADVIAFLDSFAKQKYKIHCISGLGHTIFSEPICLDFSSGSILQTLNLAKDQNLQ